MNTAEIIAERKKWENKTLKSFIEKKSERKKFILDFDDEIERLYTPAELKNWDYLEKLGFPGAFPFTRGVYPTMYRGRFWTMRQYAGFGTAEETNRRYRFLLSNGQTGLSVAFDLPTQVGYDSDDPMALGEVGKVGVAIDTLEDMRILFNSIPLDRISTSMTINSTAPVLLCMYQLIGNEQSIDISALRGTIQNDILKEYIARGTYIFPPQPSMRLVADTIIYCAKNIPKWNPISISGYHIREAGSTSVQEVAFTIADGMEYVRWITGRGFHVDKFAPRLSFFFAAHNNFFEEIAKFRAARRIWAEVMKSRFGAKNPKSCMLRFHTQTGGSTLTAQQPFNNVIRVAIQALAAVIGGTQSLHTNSYDEALALPTRQSVEIALRTQQIIAYESGVTDTVDPMGGSYYVEWLTDQIEEKVWDYLDRIENLGGMTRAVETGYVQKEIADSAYKTQMNIESGERSVIGVNRFVDKNEEIKIEVMKISEETAISQVERLKKFKKSRDKAKVKNALEQLQKVAEMEESNKNNIVPYIYSAINAQATLGEVIQALKEVFGEYRAPTVM